MLGKYKLPPFLKDTVTLASGATFSQLVVALSSPLLARLYLPEIFGEWALFTSIMIVANVIVCLRYEIAVILPDKEDEAFHLLIGSFLSSFFVSITLFILLSFLGERYLVAVKAQSILPHLFWLPVCVLLNGIFQALQSWNIRKQAYNRISVARAIASVMMVLTQIFLAAKTDFSSGGLIAGTIVNSFVLAAVLIFFFLQDNLFIKLRAFRLPTLFNVLHKYRKFPFVDVWGNLINSISWQLPNILLAVFFNQEVTGYYAMAYRIIQLPMSFVGNSIGQIFHRLAASQKNTPKLLADSTKTIFNQLVAFTLLPAIIMTISGKELFHFLFGANWVEAGRYSQILGPWMFFWFVSSPLSTIFTALEHQEQATGIHILIFASRLASLLVGGLAGNINLVLALFSTTGCLIYLFLLLLITRLSTTPFGEILRILTKTAFLSLPFVIPLLVFKIIKLQVSPGVITFLACLVLVCYYWFTMKGQVRNILFSKEVHSKQ